LPSITSIKGAQASKNMPSWLIKNLAKFLLLFISVLMILFAIKLKTNEGQIELLISNSSEVASSRTLDPFQEFQLTKSYYHKYSLDVPNFYIGLRHPNVPDTLERITPFSHRTFQEALLWECHDWPKIQAYTKKILDLCREISILPNSTPYKKQILIAGLDMMSAPPNSAVGSIKMSSSLQSKFKNISVDYQELMTTKAPLGFFPHLQWNGKNCQFHNWIKQLFGGQGFISSVDGSAVWQKIWAAFKWTFILGTLSLLFSFIGAIVLGKKIAVKQYNAQSKFADIILLWMYVLPSFWVASMAIRFLADPSKTGGFTIFPPGGTGIENSNDNFLVIIFNTAWHLVLPVICLTYPLMAYLTAHFKKGVLQSMSTAYFTTAISKGLNLNKALNQHAIPINAYTLIQFFGGIMPALLSGALIIEVIFNIPGLGRLAYQSVLAKDWNCILGIVLVNCIVVLLSQLLADAISQKLDPRTTDQSQ